MHNRSKRRVAERNSDHSEQPPRGFAAGTVQVPRESRAQGACRTSTEKLPMDGARWHPLHTICCRFNGSGTDTAKQGREMSHSGTLQLFLGRARVRPPHMGPAPSQRHPTRCL